MIGLITGMPGNGKTLRAVEKIIEAKAENDLLVKTGKAEPRFFYSNIDGLQLDYVQPLDKDWRQYPDGSFLVYDEAHQLFPSTGKPGRSDDPIINQMDEHRHRGFDMLMITQWPTKIHHEIRSLMTLHEHVHRAFGMERAGLYSWNRVQIDPYDDKARSTGSEEIWPYPKKLYQVYKSATLHTTAHKFKFPPKVRNALISIPLIGLVLWALYAYIVSPFVADATSTVKTELAPSSTGEGGKALAAAPDGDFNNPDLSELNSTRSSIVSISGCVSGRFCRCFDSQGFLLDLSLSTCRNYAEGNIAMPVRINLGNSSNNNDKSQPNSLPPNSGVEGAASPPVAVQGLAIQSVTGAR